MRREQRNKSLAALIWAMARRLSSPVSRLTLLLALYASSSHATPTNARLYKQQYGLMPSCNACHSDGGGSKLNAFGESFKKAGQSAAAFASIAKLDADGDGFSNGDEGAAKSNPGDKKSTPSAPGDWLSTIALIPREVQKLFPGVRDYLPRDATLTDADIARAKGMGAVLAKADENTIYIPLTAEKKPAGTAMIFAAEFNKKAFFLLLATDRQLKVTAVQPLNTNNVPEAARSKAYAQFVGLALDKLPAAGGTGVDAAIATAVKKAGTLIYVRLKSI